MPKMKTNRAAAKRFRTTGSGKIKRSKAAHSHLLRGKPARRLRKLRKSGLVEGVDTKSVKRLLPYAF
jgi:large subunit ribosomal protein L35